VIAILCGTAAVENVVLLAGGVADGEVSFSNCTTSVDGALSPPCKPFEPIVAKGQLLISLHAGVAYTLVEPRTGSTRLTTLEFGEECAIGEEIELTGKLWLEDCLLEPEKENTVHLVQEGKAAAAALGGLFFGVHTASLDGSANIRLKEAGTSKTFSVLAA